MKSGLIYEMFGGDTYLHWDEGGSFTDLWDEVKTNFGGLSFFGDEDGQGLCDDYPNGYKQWRPRSVTDAPDWVIAYLAGLRAAPETSTGGT